MSARRHIGIEIGDTEFRVVELRADDDGPVFSYAGVQQTEFNYGSALLHEAPYNRKLAKSFIRDLTLLFHDTGLQAPRISVSIPASSVLIAQIPVDASLTAQQQQQQLLWECRTLYGYDSDVEIDVRTYQLARNDVAHTHLVAAIPTQTSVFLKSVFAQLAFTVSDIDIGHFVIENTLSERIPEVQGVTYAVMGLFEDRCSAGVYYRGRYCGFKQGAVDLRDGYFAQVLRLLQGILERVPEAKLEAVFAFGSATTPPLLESLRSLLSIPVKKFDPKAGMPYLNPVASGVVSSLAPHTFDVPVSAAILGMQ